jgi:hypothetical protein
MLLCGACKEERPREDYTKTQLKKHGKRKCSTCTTDSPHPPFPAAFNLISEVRAIAEQVKAVRVGDNTYNRLAFAAFVHHDSPQPRLELHTIECPERPSPLPDRLCDLAATKEARRACEVMGPVFSQQNRCIVTTCSLYQGLRGWCERKKVRCRMAMVACVPPFWVTLDGAGDDESLWIPAGYTEDGRKAFQHRVLKFEDASGNVCYLDPTASQVGFDAHACAFDKELPASYNNLTVAEDTLPTDPVVNELLLKSLHRAPRVMRPGVMAYLKAITVICNKL